MFSTRIRDSPYKKRLSTLEENAKVKVRGPEGQFVLHRDSSKPAVFLSGGIGVTPFRSMIKYATDKQLPKKLQCLIPIGTAVTSYSKKSLMSGLALTKI
jgi:ferredoxin-NADP reductase